MSWREKAERVIGALARAEYERTNPRGPRGRPKKHVPYRLPAEAERLVELLGMEDQAEAEVETKALFEQLRRAGVSIDEGWPASSTRASTADRARIRSA